MDRRQPDGNAASKMDRRQPDSSTASKIDRRHPDGNAVSKMDRRQPDGNTASKMDRRQPDGNTASKMDRRQPDGNAASKMDRRQPDGNAANKMDRRQPDGSTASKMDRRQPDGNTASKMLACRSHFRREVLRMKKRLSYSIICIILLMGCTDTGSPPAPPTAGQVPASPTPTATAIPSPTPTPLPRDLTICMGAEPTSLYPYADPMGAAALIREAIYDGPIDTVGYTDQPVILAKLPSLADDDALIATVPVTTGDRVIDDAGNITPLIAGVRIRPAGCRHTDCAVTYDGTPQTMDQLRVTFTLTRSLRWADDTPVTARDSVFSFALARQARETTLPWFEERTASYTAQDDHTVIWAGVPGFLPSDYARAFWTPLPEHAWGYYTPEEMLTRPDVNRTPWGYGAYIIEEWRPGVHIRARHNPLYYRAAEGLPHFDEITFRFIGNQPATAALDALESGDCDLVTADADPAADGARLQALAAAGRIRVHVASGPVWEHITFKVQPGPGDDRPLFFADARTRQAVAYCLDRQRLIDEVIGGFSPVLDAYAPEAHPYFSSETATRYPFDPERGQMLLETVGWRDADGDGVREAQGVAGIPDGTRLNVLYRTTDAALRQEIGARVVDDLAWCGFEVFVEALDAQTFYAPGADSPLYGRGFDMVGFAWLSDIEPSCELYSSARIPGTDNFWEGENVGGYRHAEYDTYCEQALNTLPGEAGHASAHREALRHFSAELPALPLFTRPRIAVSRPDLGGFQIEPLAPETWTIERFEIVPAHDLSE